MELSAIIMGQRVRAARQAKKMKTEDAKVVVIPDGLGVVVEG